MPEIEMINDSDDGDVDDDDAVVQLGFSVGYDDIDASDDDTSNNMNSNESNDTSLKKVVPPDHVGHRSADWSTWDGGQIGGRPSWLNPRDIPKTTMMCGNCHVTPMVFVCQLYAPCDEVNDNAYHRSFYVFVCPRTGTTQDTHNNNDSNKSHKDDSHDDNNNDNKKSPQVPCSLSTVGAVRVLRTQLPKKNPFYPETIDELDVDDGCDDNGGSEDDDTTDRRRHHRLQWTKHLSDTWGVKLCAVTGQRSHGRCPIQQLEFCHRRFQKEHKKYVYDVLLRQQQQQRHNDDDKGSSSNNKNTDDVDDEMNRKKQTAIDSMRLLPSVMNESELVVEEEPFEETTTNKPRKQQQQQQQMRNTLFNNNDDDEADDDADLEQSDLNQITGAGPEAVTNDDITMLFYERIHTIPNVKTQCLRYLRWPSKRIQQQTHTPLWIRSDFRPSQQQEEKLHTSTSNIGADPKDESPGDGEDINDDDDDDKEGGIPPCQNCGAPRKFEFQLMPQMIHYLMLKKKQHTTLATTTTSAESESETKSSVASSNHGNSPGDGAALDALRAVTALIDESPTEQIPPCLVETKELAVENMRRKLLDGNDGTTVTTTTSSSSSSSPAPKNNVVEPGWGVVAVYTCTNSCGGIVDGLTISNNSRRSCVRAVNDDDNVHDHSEDRMDNKNNNNEEEELGAYIEEFAWRQPALDTVS